MEYFSEYFYVLIEFFNQYEALPAHEQHLVEEYFGNPDTNKKIRNSAAFVAESESFFLLKCNLILTDKRRMNKENIRVRLCKIKTVRSLRNCFKSCIEYILFHHTCFIWAFQNIIKIIKLKVNFVHFIALLTDINKHIIIY